MSWIKEIEYEDADRPLRKLYDRIKGPDGNIDNVLKVHSLRSHTLYGHMALYKNVLHNTNNTLPKWYLEALGVYVSQLNHCDYCFEHHFAGMSRLLANEERSAEIRKAVLADDFSGVFVEAQLAGMQYAKKLTLAIHTIQESDVLQLREQGLSDGEILEINQVVSYFNYANRTVVGLGVNTDGDVLGLSPNESGEPDNWSHS